MAPTARESAPRQTVDGLRGWTGTTAPEPPIRAELFGRARFEQHGHSLAATHEVSSAPRLGDTFYPRVEDNLATLSRARHLIEQQAHDGVHLGPAARWLLDNAALLDELTREVRLGLSRNFFRTLPRLRDEHLAGLPRIYGVAWAWVAHADSALDLPLLEAYLDAYQQTRELTLGELWALPGTLRVVLLENLRRLAERTALVQAAREAAHAWLDVPAAERDPASLAALSAACNACNACGVGEHLALQLLQREPGLAATMATALPGWLSSQLPDPAAALTRHQSEATEDHQSISNAITTLRTLDRVDWRRLFAATSPAMKKLARLPVHAAERDDTQDATLQAVERLARQAGVAESAVADALVGLCSAAADPDQPAAAPAYWWQGPGLPQLRRSLGLRALRWPQPSSAGWRRAATTAYLATLAVLAVGGVQHLMNLADPQASPWLLAAASVLLLGPMGEAVVAVVNRLISESLRPSHLPRLALADGIPAGHQTMVVMPVMLTSEADTVSLCGQLEQHRTANPEVNAQFALLSDWADADSEHAEGDQPLLDAAVAAIGALNLRYTAAAGAPPTFLLLHRGRHWSATEQRWIGWERKRGKLEQLVRLLAGGARTFWPLGAISQPARDTRYIVTLDADTDLPPGRLRELVGLAAHPLNRPRLDAERRRVVAGYGILQPRVESPLPAPDTVSWFHRLFSGQCGIDPYSAASSEIYQDLFGEGTFSGKGLLDVQALNAVLAERLPEGQVLSHDLLEGAIVRCAGVSDVTLLEAPPVHADVANARLHRWTRGDWQLLPFLWHAGRLQLLAISRWKMVDNLRRSLVAPMSLALLLLVLATDVLPLAVTLWVVAAAFSAGPLLGAVAGLAPSRDDIALGRFYRLALADLLRALALAAWHLAQLLQLAMMYGDAIGRALYRQWVSRRLLLQWTTAAAAQAAARNELPALVAAQRRVPLAAAVLAAALAGLGALDAAAAALLLLWAASPLWTWLASQPRPPREQRLDADSRHWLTGIARDTWRYYERHVGAEDNHLPPDNVQLSPHAMVAHRTSPTNIGMYMLSCACAQALGFIGRAELAERLQATLDTLERLPRHQGHFYNWYETRTLAVLAPPYVSTVDSGNCCGHLLAVAQACLQQADSPSAATPLRQALAASARRLRPLQPVLQGSSALRQLALLCDGGCPWPEDADAAIALRQQLGLARVELDALRLGPDGADGSTDNDAVWLLHDHLATLDSIARDLLGDPAATAAALRQVALRCRRLALAPDFARLYDPQRKLLHIGLRVDSQQLDDNHYDLLASEARLTSLLAIAKGDVPHRHWAALGRPFFALGNEVGLKSWSGSMFEYLMPTLVLDEPIGSVLHQVTRSAVAVHQQDGRARGTPWGMSESAVAVQDHTLAYQYGPQGVARLALRRTPADDHVVAPYASALALMVAPAPALANLRTLQAQGAREVFGFIEAIDYTPQRQRAGQTYTPVNTFMAHHQGMSLVAFADLLCDGAPRRWAMADPLLRAVAPLLHERAPREVPVLKDPPPLPPPRRARGKRLVHDALPLAEALPATQLLGNGRHAVVLRSHGGGYSLWDGLGLTRWRDDLPRDEQGTWLYLRRGQEHWHSITAHPAPDPEAEYRSRIQADSVVFDAAWKDLRAECRVWVSPEDDCELRHVTLVNSGRGPLSLTLASYAELTLTALRADEAHPAFSNLFVQASWHESEQALYLVRCPRLADEQPLYAVHFLVAEDPSLRVTACSDRARWIGRHGSPAQPLGGGGLQPTESIENASAERTGDDADRPRPPVALPGIAVDTGLDPVASIAARLRLAAGATLELTFCTAASRQPEVLAALVDKYRQASHRARSTSMAYTMAGIRLRELQFDADTWTALLQLNTRLTSLVAREIAAPLPRGDGRMPLCDRRLLWRHGISGDRPIVLVTIHREQGMPLVQALARALEVWRLAGLAVDLVVVNAEPPSYQTPVQHQLQALAERWMNVLANGSADAAAGARGAIHLLAGAAVDDALAFTLQLLARVRLQADGRPLAAQMAKLHDDAESALQRRRGRGSRSVRTALGAAAGVRPAATPAFSFAPLDGALGFAVDLQRHPARPWVNVLANPGFGCQVSEMGSGFCWAGNSRMNQITGWSNDALRDPPSEWLLLHDRDSQRTWPLGRALQGAGTRQVEHGIGYTRMRQSIDGLDVVLCWCVDPDLALRQLQVSVRAQKGRPRRLQLVAVLEWTLGGSRAERLTLDAKPLLWRPAESAQSIGPEGPAQRALTATQLDHLGGFGGGTAFIAWRPAQPADASGAEAVAPSADDEWTCDRSEFHDANGALVLPRRLGQRHGLGLDACAALGVTLALPAGAGTELTLLLGHGASPAAAQALLREAWPVDPEQRLARQRGRLDAVLGTVQVQSPDPAFDALVNHWLPYQTLACRLWARAGFYQAGGAFGFRDQLQDAMSLVQHSPALLAAQIRHNASRQFPEGDVQHWWHEPGGAGVRTHFSDDRLWLPLACALYLQRTGDAALLDERLPFLDGATVPDGAEDIYETPRISDERASVYEHAARAIDVSLRSGAHGLPLFGTGDWNDGMNRVGHLGRGESVWLGWMLYQVIDGMLPIAAARGDHRRVTVWAEARDGWRQALERDGWDGSWYRRGFFDDGSPLGSAANAECRIDLIAQAWAVLSGAADPARARTAMASAMALLVDPPLRLVRLLDPPLQHAQPNAGYIQAYPPGVRENGGQYNHAAVWALMALAELGEVDAAWQVFIAMSPAHRSAEPVLAARYAIEPNVMAGDIYSQPPYAGRGGWSWYTGSAGWLVRASIESICGLVLQRDRMTLNPALPSHWNELRLRIRRDGRLHHVVLCANAATVRAVQTREPGALRAERGQPILLQDLPDGSVHWLLAGPPASAAASTAAARRAAEPAARQT